MNDKVCTLLFLKKKKEILLAMKKRGWGDEKFNGVGGKVEETETIDQALIRECKEEIKVTPIKYEKVAEHDFVYKNENASLWHMYVHVFFCDKWQGDPQETEEMKPQWFNIKDIPYDKMWEDDKFWLPEVLQGKKISGIFTFDTKNKLLTHSLKEVGSLAGE